MNIPDQKDKLTGLVSKSAAMPPLPPTPEMELGAGGEMKKGMSLSSIASRFFKKERAEKQEVRVDEYVKSIESKLDVTDVVGKMKEVATSGVAHEYESKVRRFFDEGLCSVDMNSKASDPKDALKSLTFGMDVYKYMALKLKESALVTNVEYLTITTTVEKEQMTHVVEFELKASGQNWSSIFSKFIGKDIYHQIQWAQGLVDGYHRYNATLMRDSFVFAFSHRRMELMSSLSENQKTKASLNQEM